MKRLAAIVSAAALYVGSGSAIAASPGAPQSVKAGTPYAVARGMLLKARALPNTAGSQAPGCASESMICRVYPELDGCSQGRHFCRFEWRTATGQPFYIITAGEDVATLTVQ